MRSTLQAGVEAYRRVMNISRAVIVVEGSADDISDALSAATQTKGVRLRAAGAVDDRQYGEILKVLSAHSCVLPQ